MVDHVDGTILGWRDPVADRGQLGIVIPPPGPPDPETAYVLTLDAEGNYNVEVFVGRTDDTGQSGLDLALQAFRPAESFDSKIADVLRQSGPNWWHISAHFEGEHEGAFDEECLVCRGLRHEEYSQEVVGAEAGTVGVEDRDPMKIATDVRARPTTINEGDWCIQAIIESEPDLIHIEILDPKYWNDGPELPAEHISIAREIGFEMGEGMFVLELPCRNQDELLEGTQVMVEFMNRAWGPVGSVRAVTEEGPGEVEPSYPKIVCGGASSLLTYYAFSGERLTAKEVGWVMVIDEFGEETTTQTVTAAEVVGDLLAMKMERDVAVGSVLAYTKQMYDSTLSRVESAPDKDKADLARRAEELLEELEAATKEAEPLEKPCD